MKEVLSGNDITFIRDLTRQAGDLALSMQHEPFDIQRKRDRSIVTHIDRDIQDLILKELTERFSGMRFVHEEQFDLESHPIRKGELTAVIDPIDGTAVFSMLLPLWSVSVGIFLGHTPLYGFVYAPGCDLFFHNDNTASYCNGNQLKADNTMTVDSETSILCSSENIRQFDFNFPGKIRNLGSTALHACLTADNRRNRVLAFAGNSSLWDWAGALPILDHAGVSVTYMDGNKPDLREVVDNRYAFLDHLVAYNTVDVKEIQKIFRQREV